MYWKKSHYKWTHTIQTHVKGPLYFTILHKYTFSILCVLAHPIPPEWKLFSSPLWIAFYAHLFKPSSVITSFRKLPFSQGFLTSSLDWASSKRHGVIVFLVPHLVTQAIETDFPEDISQCLSPSPFHGILYFQFYNNFTSYFFYCRLNHAPLKRYIEVWIPGTCE